MKANEFVDKLCVFARESISAKCTNPKTLGMIGFATVGIGRKTAEKFLSPYLEMCTDEAGDIDLDGLKESALSAVNMAKSIPVLFGMISIEPGDVVEFFSSIGK